MSLQSFADRTIGGSYGNPQSNTYVGQCVSYARLYMESELGVPTYPDGDAKDYWNNSISQKYFDKVPNPQNGDIVVYGAVSGNPYGHIGIWYNGQLLSQNLNVPLHVTIYRLDGAGNRLGYLRKKGGEEVVSQEQVDSMAVELLGRHATQEELAHMTGQPFWTVFTAWGGGNPEHIANVNKDKPTPPQANNMYYQLIGRDGTAEEIDHGVQIGWWPLFQGLTGKNPDFVGNKVNKKYEEIQGPVFKEVK